ncbi:MAG: HDOD domain-containing protein [Desulfobacterales bacterium]|nr:HDOD domain-containing protein [Desulfobacterales bacterium]MBF0397386.1 HDOD domain-containing protein [Desulfobacterales bacterium]
MGMLNIDELKEGMILDCDITDNTKRYRIPRETLLNTKHIRVFKMWGIKEVNIKGISEKKVETEIKTDDNQKLIQEASKIIKIKFIHNNLKHEGVQELFKQSIIYKAQQIKEGKLKPILPKADSSSNIDIKKLKIDENELVKKVTELPTLPEIFYKLNSVINDPRSSANDIEKVISKDSSLTLKVLKMANSSFYGLKTKIDNISRAILSLGTTEIGMLAIGLTFVSYFKDIPNELVDMESFWRHSIACAIASKTIASSKSVPGSERFFIGGLIHDIGRLVLFKFHPANVREAMLYARQNNLFLYEVEDQLLNAKHSTIGRLLVKKWKLPVSIENMITFHHKPTNAQDPIDPAIINLADLIVNALDIGTSGEYLVPILEVETWKVLGVTPSIFETAINQINKQLQEIIKFFIHEK